ncbi:MAG: hypothetical protein R2685_07865 [Candidatus Nitrosocosmicus sp.]|nr:hypothetical protein [Candidatus Nitrosocosmicus sp.]
MVSDNTKQDILVTVIILAVIGGIAGAILYNQSLIKEDTDNTNHVPNPNPNPNNNNNNTNDTNNNNNMTDFDKICAIEPKAEVCIKPLASINGTNKTN